MRRLLATTLFTLALTLAGQPPCPSYTCSTNTCWSSSDCWGSGNCVCVSVNSGDQTGVCVAAVDY